MVVGVVQRYGLVHTGLGTGMMPVPGGDYLRAEDVEAELASYRRRLQALEAQLRSVGQEPDEAKREA